MEDEILNKYNLFWSKYFELDSNFNASRFNDYLYMPERFSECFWTLFERLNYIHDYCLNTLITSELKLKQLQDFADSCHFSEEAYYWEYNVDVIAKATILIIMCSFTEWALKRVLLELGEDLRSTRIQGANIDFFLSIIKRKYFKNLDISAESVATLHCFRKIRNKFAHGDWLGLDADLKIISFKRVFASVCEIFVSLEDFYWKDFDSQS